MSEHFFMRDFLYSEIANHYGILNAPADPRLAVEAGTNLCRDLLEPLRKKFGHIHIRSAYRSTAVNSKGAENKNQHNCGSNERNRAKHIWDERDPSGNLGATACIQVTSFADEYENGADWKSLAWWIHDHLPYNSAFFFNNRAALNLNWRENPERWIRSWIELRGGYLTQADMDNHLGDHSEYYSWIDEKIK